MSEAKVKFWVEGSMSKENMGEAIALYRKRTGLNQEDFSKEIGCSAKILVSAENGKGNHVYGTLLKMCDKFNLRTYMEIDQVDEIV